MNIKPGLRRMLELYSNGGLREATRGIRDYVAVHVAPAIEARLRTYATLTVGDNEIKITISTKHDVRRACDRNEPALRRDLFETVQPDDVVWDVGANIGVHTLVACAAGADQVVAFEPGSGPRHRLQSNLRVNGFGASVRPYALGAAEAKAVLTEANHPGARHVSEAGSGEEVTVRLGDRVLGPAPDVVKIDVEGAEISVLEGMAETLRDARVCYVEVHECVSRDRVVDHLEAAGLAVTAKFDGILRAESMAQSRIFAR